jgi:UDP-GlcNAc:undecaprenyl-phosphate/decaprenyl-phosphate GlcNAc-1-phosphate transferase
MVELSWLRILGAHCLNAFLLSLMFSIVMARVAPRIGFVDFPTSRKRHNSPIPLVGLAVFVAFGISALLLGRFPSGASSLFVGLSMIVLVGVVDDKVDLPAAFKLLLQVVSVIMVASSHAMEIVSIGNLDHGQPLYLNDWALPVTIFAVVGMINAVNMIDGLDGLAGGTSLTSLIWFAVAAQLLGRSDDLLIILALAGSVLGFLVLNIRSPWRPQAVVFLGDSGSMMLGLALAFVAIRLSQHPAPALSPIAALWVCALPVIDTLSVIVRRLAARQNPMASDRQHCHHLLLQSGFSVGQVVALLIGVNFALGAVGVLGWSLGVPDTVMLAGLIVPAWLHCVVIGCCRNAARSAARLSQ